MNRTEFFSLFNQSFISNEGLCQFDIDVRDDIEFNQNLELYFSPFFDTLNLPSFLSQLSIKKDYDAYFEEDNPDSDICRYNCVVNVHEFYDQYVLNSSNSLTMMEIFRIENENGQGLYSSTYAAKPVNIDTQPAPTEDKLLNSIFNTSNKTDYNYMRQWNFGFGDLNDIKTWFSDIKELEKLEKEGFSLKKIYIPQDFVITGQQQLIFKKNQVAYSDTLNLSLLKSDFHHNPQFRM